MSNVCAKPTCAELARVWLDFAPAERRVTERAERSGASVGLCASHGERFGVPDGWDYERLTEQAEATEVQPAPAIESRSADRTAATVPDLEPKRAYSRERPWFLARSSDTASTTIESDVAPADDTDSHVLEHEPSAGSLLHRAFHGPDRQMDLHRAAHDELERRRVARADEDACGTIALPFPPSDAEHQIAVS